MADFIPITTQEEFDAMIKPRIERERNIVTKEFEDKLAGYADYDELKANNQTLLDEKASWETSSKEKEEKIKALEDQLTDANAKVKTYELERLKTSAALANGIPFEFRDRITGDTEDAINEDAKKLADIFKAQNRKNLPPFEPGGSDDDSFEKSGKVNQDRAMKKFQDSLKSINE